MLISSVKQNLNNESKSKAVSYKGLIDGRGIIKRLSDPSSLATTVVLESFVTGGRGYNAYQRGGIDEMRESVLDNSLSALLWMKGVDMFNSFGNWIGKKFLKIPTTEFHVGCDALRNPFKNLSIQQIRKHGEEASKPIIKKLAVFKFTKIILSAIASTSLIGFIFPKANQKLTDIIITKRKELEKNEKIKNSLAFMKHHTIDVFDKQINTDKFNSFKGVGLEKFAQVSHVLENNTIGKMLINDAGMIYGRKVSARNQDEGWEYVFRDVTSLFGYFVSTPLLYGMFQKFTKTSNVTNLDPVATHTLSDYVRSQLVKIDGNKTSLTINEFKKRIVGELSEDSKNLLEKIPFKSDVISLNELKKHITNGKLLKKAEYMSRLQPQQYDIGHVLTKGQVKDVLKNGAVSDPIFLYKIYRERFGAELTNPYKFISMKKITRFRTEMDKYLQSIMEEAERSNNGKIDIKLLTNLSKKSFRLSAGFRGIAMLGSGLFLAEAIPKAQYAITEYRTGSKLPPMFRKYEENK